MMGMTCLSTPGAISSLVSCAVEECHTPSLYGGLLLARQCSLEGAHLFPSYRQWVQVCFLPPPPLPPSLLLPPPLPPPPLSFLLFFYFSSSFAANVWRLKDYSGHF